MIICRYRRTLGWGRKTAAIGVGAILLLGLGWGLFPVRLAAAPAEVWFSPDGGAEKALTSLLGKARESLDIAVYTFTSRYLAAAVVAAWRRGVKVRVLLDGNDESDYSKGRYLRRQGIAVRYARGKLKPYRRKGRRQKLFQERKYGLMHHKFVVVDGKWVATGSFNWTASAQKWNCENLLILKSSSLARRFTAEFNRIWRTTFAR